MVRWTSSAIILGPNNSLAPPVGRVINNLWNLTGKLESTEEKHLTTTVNMKEISEFNWKSINMNWCLVTWRSNSQGQFDTKWNLIDNAKLGEIIKKN